MTATGDMVIQAEFRSDLIADRLAHVRVWNEENRLLAEGYMGLYPINDGQAYLGESRLDVLAPDLREMISRGCLCYFGVAPQVGSRLIARDRQTLEKSLLAAVSLPAAKSSKNAGTSPNDGGNNRHSQPNHDDRNGSQVAQEEPSATASADRRAPSPREASSMGVV